MERGSVTVMPHESGDITIGVADDDRDVLIAGQRMSVPEARLHIQKVRDAIAVALSVTAEAPVASAGTMP